VNDEERWLYFDGPAPQSVRPVLEALRSAPPAPPRDKDRMASRFFERLDAVLAQRSAASRAPRDTPPPEPAAPVPVTPEPAVTRAPASIARTAQSLQLPAALREPRGALPSKPAPPAMRSALGETAPVGSDAIEKARAPLPFPSSTVGAGVIPPPDLSLEQYASLRAELTVHPERWARTLAVYTVMDQATLEALDEHWRRRFAKHPEERPVFETALAKFTGWLRSLLAAPATDTPAAVRGTTGP
jgi:hypothetical protein